ncbi:MAG: nucleotidyltransferase family protein, partial [Rhodococcus sp. (in: high G+C Gram-positive bacteria)]|uniref:molybdenum cofactor guanylyltransferase n=1 Tax=Rhodococcus sp. TaxID=1831 RepID=UPI003BB60992
MTRLSGSEAIIVAGGRASRMGGVDKPALVVHGRRMLDSALAAVAECRRVTVVGPHRDDLDPAISQVQETPAGAGPVAALAAAPIPTDALVLTLAADLPFVTSDTLIALVDALRDDADADAAFAVDEDGHTQFLLAAWRGAALAARLGGYDGAVVNRPVKSLLPDRYVTVAVPGTEDCDTDEDLRRARTARGGVIAADPADARTLVRQAMRPVPV